MNAFSMLYFLAIIKILFKNGSFCLQLINVLTCVLVVEDPECDGGQDNAEVEKERRGNSFLQRLVTYKIQGFGSGYRPDSGKKSKKKN